MKVTIEIEMKGTAFEGQPFDELSRIIRTAERKARRQSARSDECICDTPEADDKLYDINGNSVGFVRLEK